MRCKDCGADERPTTCRYPERPCRQACLELAMAAARESRISYACQESFHLQSELVGADQSRRHPYDGNRPRPRWSGYCVDLRCGCECHLSEPLPTKQRTPLPTDDQPAQVP